jgi:hypothetical protein
LFADKKAEGGQHGDATVGDLHCNTTHARKSKRAHARSGRRGENEEWEAGEGKVRR